MVVCHKCGTTLLEGQRICPSCGSDNSNTSRPRQPLAQASAATTGATDANRTGKSINGPGSVASSTTKAIIAGVVAIAFATGLIFWQVKAGRAYGVNLSSDDLSTIVASFPPQAQMQLADDEGARKEFANDLRQLLAIAEAAKAEGIAERPDMQRQASLARSLIIGQTYMAEQAKKSSGGPPSGITREEVESFLKEPGQEEKFEEFLADAKARNPQAANLPEAQKQDLKRQWAELMVAERKGRQTGIDKDRRVELQIMLQEARALANQYAKEQLVERVKPTEPEIDAYIAAHPEFDPTKARGHAEDILKRARAGEDFAKLAEKYSSDPGSKTSGGELGWFGKGRMVKVFEDTAFNLQPGQISDVVESEFGYHIIKVEERGMKPGPDGTPQEQVHARHILISSGSRPANPFAPTPSPRDQARIAVEQEKQKKIIAEIVQRSHVKVADDFTVKRPERPPMPEGMPPGMEEEELPVEEPPPVQPEPPGDANAAAKPKRAAKPAIRRRQR